MIDTVLNTENAKTNKTHQFSKSTVHWKVGYAFILSFDKHLLWACYKSATIPGPEDTKMSKIWYLLSKNLWYLWKRQKGKRNQPRNKAIYLLGTLEKNNLLYLGGGICSETSYGRGDT